MDNVEHIAEIIRSGGCVVLGMGVTPERYRSLLQGETNQDYLVIGPKESSDASLIASKMSTDPVISRSLPILDLEVDAYLIRSEKRTG